VAVVRLADAVQGVEEVGMSGYLTPGHAPLKFHPLANLFPMLSDPELDDLGEDIRANGQVETVKLHQGMVLDGRNRYTACGKKGLGVRTELFMGSTREALAWVISKNLKRRHLTESQRAMVAAKLATLKLGDNQHSQAAPIGAPSLDFGGDAPEPVEPTSIVSQSEAADVLNVGRRSVQRATVVQEKGSPELQEAVEQGKVAVSTAADIAESLPQAEQTQVAAMSEKDILEAASKIRKEKNDKRRTQRIETIKAKSAGNTELNTVRKFPVIYMDPPTKFAAGDSDRSTENHYPTMDEAQIAALPVGELATDDAVLFIWTTVPWLRKTMTLIEGWGFAYVSELVWDKQSLGLGFWNRNVHETLLIATRGKIPAPDPSTLKPSLYSEARGRHSAKPEYFRDLITGYYPDLPKVELFSRVDGALPEGWHAWGNEARVQKQQTLGIETEGEAA
jgi:N6-adenosine-specific RNA methylase IME4